MLQSLENPLVQRSLEFATLSLAGKKRHSGEAVTEHCLKVALVLERFHVSDPTTISVAILHHSLSSGAATIEDIRKEFGEEITSMLITLDSLNIIKLNDQLNAEFAENLRKMFLCLAKDLRIVLIKLADLYDNLQTLEYVDESKRKVIARETIEIFAPLVERLGIGEMKGEMQDLAFMYLYPEEYKRVTNLVYANREQLQLILLKAKGELRIALDKAGIPYTIESRAKHLYSLYTKLSRPEINFDMNLVYDLIAFRIITNSVEDCYRVLDIVHTLWRSKHDYVRDYIANPKQNGYQSIHTTVYGERDKPFEVQIRTQKMHQEAEFGVAAHWNYAEMKSTGSGDEQLSKGVMADDQKLDWVKSLSSWQDEIVDNEEFLKSVKTDLFGARIFVFTPKGDVKDLPADSTPVDFAYNVHSNMGDYLTGAKINGKLVSLDTKLKNADVCEVTINRDKVRKPNRDWLRFVKTSVARRKIKKAYLE